MNINDIFDKIFVIHLKENKNRLYNLKKTIGDKLKYSLFIGHKPQPNQININFDWEYYLEKNTDLKEVKTKVQAINHYKRIGKNENRIINRDTEIVNEGELGCLISHINVLKYAKKNKFRKILILEDDIRLHKEIEKKIDIVNQIEDWSLIYLGGAQDNWKNIKFEDKNDKYYYANETRGTFAYCVKSDFFDILINKFEEKKKPVDKYLIDLQTKYKFPVLYPNLIVSDITESNIREFRDNTYWFKRFRWNKYDYLKKNKLIVLILTCQKNLGRQLKIKNTYLKDINYEYYFVIGTKNRTQIKQDILYINIEDKYENLPLKMLYAYKYLFENKEFDYILKIDDDVVIDFNKLEDIPYYNYEYYGKLVGEKNFNRKSHFKKVSTNSRWHNKVYDKSYYGKWCGGGFGYFLSKKSVEILIKNPKIMEDDLLEDKAVGDTLKLFGGEEYNSEEKNDMSRFICDYYKRNYDNKKIIYFEVEEEDMIKVYSQIK